MYRLLKIIDLRLHGLYKNIGSITMGYTALYRQFRPKSFDSIAGQDHIVKTLKNQIKNNRISHAYLFCGPRGTGKTSAALVFAHAVNCMSNVDGDVCGECEYCRQTGENIDIAEIDAASNNGVDEIRNLRETIRYMPSVGKYKVYIIDEVHMLSQGAFNALLKTLEEPPAYVIFILATTEAHKIPATIVSRCQRYDFKSITTAEIINVLSGILKKINVSADRDALAAIARWANGGLRDAIGLLDQSIDNCDGHITVDCVNSIIGTADVNFTLSFIESISKSDTPALLKMTDEIIESGKDPAVFAKDVTNHLRNIMMYSIMKSTEMLSDTDDTTLERYKELSADFTSARLLRSIELLSSLESQLRYTGQTRILFELTLIRICRPETADDIEALRDTVEELSKKLESGAFVPSANTQSDVVSAVPRTKAKQVQPKAEEKQPTARPVSSGSSSGAWSEYLNDLKKTDVKLYGLLKNTSFVQTNENTAEIVFSEKDSIFAQSLEKLGKIELIKKALAEKLGKEIALSVKCSSSKPQSAGDKIEKALEGLLSKDKIEII